MRVRFTPSGDRQSLGILAFILAQRPAAARRFYVRAGKVLKRLERFPESGRRIPEFPELPYREVIIRPYRFFYRVVRDTVWIVAVWHGAQLPFGSRSTRVGLGAWAGRTAAVIES